MLKYLSSYFVLKLLRTQVHWRKKLDFTKYILLVFREWINTLQTSQILLFLQLIWTEGKKLDYYVYRGFKMPWCLLLSTVWTLLLFLDILRVPKFTKISGFYHIFFWMLCKENLLFKVIFILLLHIICISQLECNRS